MRGSYRLSRWRAHTPEIPGDTSFGNLQFQAVGTANGTGEEAGKITRLLVEMNRGKHQFDGPFGCEPFCFQRVGKAQATDREIGPCGAGTVELQIDVLSFG